jgi:putative peptide zinc metalloprotease protein
MRFGPTSLQVSSVLSKGLRRPKLRGDLRISEQTVAGEKSFVIKNRETNSYNRYGTAEYELLTLCDGTRTPAEIAQEMTLRDPDQPIDEAEVLEFLDSVDPAMWERSMGEKNLAVLERIRDERKSRLDQSNALYITFKAWDPDKILTRIDPYLSWMFTRGFVFFSLVLFITVAYLLAGDWSRVQRDTAELYSFASKTAYDLWAFWVLFLILGGIHEFGHGLTCKHFGGEVHQMGFMLIYFTPAFFTDTTDITLFEKVSRRQWVIFAGIWIELCVCGVSTLLWHFTVPGSPINDLAYKMMLLSAIQGALLNLNPLVKADGYYALSQFLEIDNLREDSFDYLKAAASKYLLRRDIDLPAAGRRHRRIFLTFGIAAFAYSAGIVIVTVFFARNVLVTTFGEWGYLLTILIVYYFARNGLKAAMPAVRAWLRQKREEFMAWKVTRLQAAGAAGLALLIFIPPFSSTVSTGLLLEPGRVVPLRAEAGGRVKQVFVREGDNVKSGQVLAILEDPEIRAKARIIAAQLALASSNLRHNEGSDPQKAAQATHERSRLQQELAVAQKEVDALEIRAPFDGVVTTPEMEQRVGEYLSAGDEFCRVVDRSTMRARVLVRDWELEDVRPGTAAMVKVVSFPYRTFSGHVDQILPAAADDRPVSQPQKLERMGQQLTNYFAVVVEFPNPDGSLREGMTGTARISAKRSPLAWKIGREAWRWLRSQVW